MRRYLIIAGLGIAALVIIGSGVALLVDKNPKLQNAIEKSANLNAAKNTNVANNSNTSNTNTTQVTDQAAILFVARNFTERFGSSTSDDGFAGVLSATTWGTAALNTQIRKNVAPLTGNRPATFHSYVTRALSFEFVRRDAASATVMVGTERTETIDATVDHYTQNLQLQLVKEGTSWKVAVASWQPK